MDLTIANAVTTTTRTETDREQRTLSELLPAYSVILHNDDHNAMDYVAVALVKSVPGLETADAVRIMLEAHEQGRAVVITCPLEPAEYYRDRVRTFGLGVTIEKAA